MEAYHLVFLEFSCVARWVLLSLHDEWGVWPREVLATAGHVESTYNCVLINACKDKPMHDVLLMTTGNLLMGELVWLSPG
jgi:hypothetical protein